MQKKLYAFYITSIIKILANHKHRILVKSIKIFLEFLDIIENFVK